MDMYETSDLHQRVARYEAAVEELRAAHQDVRNVLLDQVLYERWQQMGAELGFADTSKSPGSQPPAPPQDLIAMSSSLPPQLSEAWSG